MKRFLKISIALLICLVMSISLVYAVTEAQIMDDLKKIAEDGHYRFIPVTAQGITADIRSDLETNDKIYVEENPMGSISITVLDAATNKPIKDALCILNYSSLRYSTKSDGSKVQIANPFLVFNLGNTPENGMIKYDKTFFYKTSKTTTGGTPYASGLVVQCAYVDDLNPDVVINSNITINISAENNPDAVMAAFKDIKTIKFDDMVTKLKSLTKTYSDVLRTMFDYEYAVFSENTVVEISSSNKAYKALIDSGKKKLTLKELRQYIDTNKALFDSEIAARSYADFGGFVTNYKFDYNPSYEYTVTYKDGTKKIETDKSYIGLYIFKDVTGGTRNAEITNAFSYTAYIYHKDYNSGKSIGTRIAQDLVDKNVSATVYLSKDVPPLVVSKGYYSIYGTLKDANNVAMADTTIKLIGIDQSRKTDANGYFSFDNLTDGKVNFTIIDPQNGQVLKSNVLYNGKTFNGDSIDLALSSSNVINRVDITVNGRAATSSNNGSMPVIWWILIILGVIILLLIALFFANRKIFFMLLPFLNKNDKIKCNVCMHMIDSKLTTCQVCGSKICPVCKHANPKEAAVCEKCNHDLS